MPSDDQACWQCGQRLPCRCADPDDGDEVPLPPDEGTITITDTDEYRIEPGDSER